MTQLQVPHWPRFAIRSQKKGRPSCKGRETGAYRSC